MFIAKSRYATTSPRREVCGPWPPKATWPPRWETRGIAWRDIARFANISRRVLSAKYRRRIAGQIARTAAKVHAHQNYPCRRDCIGRNGLDQPLIAIFMTTCIRTNGTDGTISAMVPLE